MKFIASAALVFAIALGASACASSPAVEITDSTVVIDVRTPAEFVSGHLDGALNIDVQSPTFESEVGALPTDGEYVVYCKSGNRAGQAISRMESMGFTTLTNAGGLSEAATATGLAIVTGE